MIKKILLSFTFITLMSSGILLSQNPPHPNGGSTPGIGNVPVGGGSPLGGGLLIMVSLAVGYSVNKIYFLRRNSKEDSLL